jgi:hypothetical protein
VSRNLRDSIGAGVLVGAALLARAHRQHWLGSIQGLDLGLLVDTQHQGLIWRIGGPPSIGKTLDIRKVFH